MPWIYRTGNRGCPAVQARLRHGSLRRGDGRRAAAATAFPAARGRAGRGPAAARRTRRGRAARRSRRHRGGTTRAALHPRSRARTTGSPWSMVTVPAPTRGYGTPRPVSRRSSPGGGRTRPVWSGAPAPGSWPHWPGAQAGVTPAVVETDDPDVIGSMRLPVVLDAAPAAKPAAGTVDLSGLLSAPAVTALPDRPRRGRGGRLGRRAMRTGRHRPRRRPLQPARPAGFRTSRHLRGRRHGGDPGPRGHQ